MFSTATLLWGMVFSSIGLGYLLYGKRQGHVVAWVCGLALMIYSYFFSDPYLIVAIGVGLMLVPRFVRA